MSRSKLPHVSPNDKYLSSVYETEEEARLDWETIAPEYRTEERLKIMLSNVIGKEALK